MNTDEEQIDFGMELLSDLAEGEFDPADYPGAMSAVISKVIEVFVPSSLWAEMIKRDQDTFVLQWIEPHAETLSYDEYVALKYGKEKGPFSMTKTQNAEIMQLLRRQEKMSPSRKRELLLSRKEALLLLTALYMPGRVPAGLGSGIAGKLAQCFKPSFHGFNSKEGEFCRPCHSSAL